VRHPKREDPLALVELSVIVEEATSRVRHDLRNKLGSIRNAAFFMKRRLSKTEEWSADPRLDAMATLLESDVTVANELLEPRDGRLHSRHAAKVDPAACAARAVEHARVATGIQFQLDLPPAEVVADAAEISVAVRCLVENAAEAMNGGGVVILRGKVEGDRYWISVNDRGPGIADDARELVMGAFYTTKPGHAGLGLNVTQRIAQRHGGKVVIGPSTPTVVSFGVGMER
jgi:signal transduction histidine kinase